MQEMKKMNKQKILIVDDVPQNVAILDNLLSFKYNILASTNATTAIEIAKDELPDLILLDIVMPEISGLEACEILKADITTKNIPIIFITAKTDDESIVEGFQKGAVDYITKPFKPDELLVRVNTHLSLVGYQKFLEQKVDMEVKLRQEQEQVLIQNSKMSEMGDMINNIAHQWRQPTSRVTLLLSNALMSLEDGEFDKEYLEGKIKSSIEQMEFISATIDDFANFFSPKKVVNNFYVKNSINKTIKIIKGTFDSFGITIDINDDNFLTYGCENELAQVVLIILSNTKDAFVKNKIENPTITIDVDARSNKIKFNDNAGGIPDNIIDNIFDHYFSTKEQSICSGIGLYTARIIMHQTFNGKIVAENKNNGAQFTLSF